jgi:protein-L-isoaspartate O-methyltransferase
LGILLGHIVLQQYWSNKGMVENLQSYGIIKSSKVSEVMANIDRGLFVPNFQPYIDFPMAIGYNATVSAPRMHATCLQLLENYLQPGMHALDVGSGIFCITVTLIRNIVYLICSFLCCSFSNRFACVADVNVENFLVP